MIKKTLIFAGVYILLNLILVFVLFSWNSFGGSKSTNYLQKAITFMFTFPGSLLVFKSYNGILLLLINAIFWSFIFYLTMLIFYKIVK